MVPDRRQNLRQWHHHIDAIGLGISVMALGLSVGSIYDKPAVAYTGIALGIGLAALHWNPSKDQSELA